MTTYPSRLCSLLAGLCLFSAWAAPLNAWNKPGHMVTAAIAYDELTASDKTARDKVLSILREHPQYDTFWKPKLASAKFGQKSRTLFMLAARWPDDIRGDEDYHHGAWHYINYSFTPPATTLGAVLDTDENILLALTQNMAVLQSNAPRSAKAVALCWVLHLMGDLHQPLHATALVNATYSDGDSGGTEFFVRPNGSVPDATSLHSYWDQLVFDSEQYESVGNRAAALRQNSAFARSNLPELSRSFQDFKGIAEAETFTLAVSAAYKNGTLQGSKKKNSSAPALPSDYETTVKPLAERRAVLAGYRLADLFKFLY